MNILYYHQHFSTLKGSTGTRSYEFARHLISKGHRVTMVCGSYKLGATGLEGEPKNGILRGNVEGIDVIEICLPYSNNDSLLKRSITFFRFAIKSVKIAFCENYDIIFATSTPLTAGIPGIVSKIFAGKPFIFEVRDLWPELPREMKVIKNGLILNLMDILEWCSYHFADACVALSPGIEKGIKRRSATGKKVAMVPNGCDLDIFVPGDEKSPFGEKKFTAIFCGAHGIANGLDSIIDAAEVLKKRGRSDIQIIFLGDGKLKAHIMQRARDAKLDNCLFMDPVPKTELAKILPKIDVGLMTLANVQAFYYGTSPNKFFDYIAAGIAVLNNYPGWLAELIDKNKCGIAVAPDNEDLFADALIKMADNPQETRLMGKNARVLAEREFGRKKLMDQLFGFVEEVFNSKRIVKK